MTGGVSGGKYCRPAEAAVTAAAGSYPSSAGLALAGDTAPARRPSTAVAAARPACRRASRRPTPSCGGCTREQMLSAKARSAMRRAQIWQHPPATTIRNR
eukprot:scaffold4780_cov120-Isochrysis_galbana.AAC.6